MTLSSTFASFQQTLKNKHISSKHIWDYNMTTWMVSVTANWIEGGPNFSCYIPTVKIHRWNYHSVDAFIPLGGDCLICISLYMKGTDFAKQSMIQAQNHEDKVLKVLLNAHARFRSNTSLTQEVSWNYVKGPWRALSWRIQLSYKSTKEQHQRSSNDTTKRPHRKSWNSYSGPRRMRL